MLNVGLTGNIASGKSTVVELFRKWGATVIDADALAREAEAPGGAVLAAIARRFGADVLAQGGSLDRAALRAKVMGDDAALAALNAIVHPAVQQRRLELQRAAAGRSAYLLRCASKRRGRACAPRRRTRRWCSARWERRTWRRWCSRPSSAATRTPVCGSSTRPSNRSAKS